MSDQPTGEWTADYVASFIRESCEAPGHISLQSIADAHNAALADERESRKDYQGEAYELNLKLAVERDYGNRLTVQLEEAQQQFAAAVEALKEVRKLIAIHGNVHPALTIIDAALGKVSDLNKK